MPEVARLQNRLTSEIALLLCHRSPRGMPRRGGHRQGSPARNTLPWCRARPASCARRRRSPAATAPAARACGNSRAVPPESAGKMSDRRRSPNCKMRASRPICSSARRPPSLNRSTRSQQPGSGEALLRHQCEEIAIGLKDSLPVGDLVEELFNHLALCLRDEYVEGKRGEPERIGREAGQLSNQ